jgi:hypothetical protein
VEEMVLEFRELSVHGLSLGEAPARNPQGLGPLKHVLHSLRLLPEQSCRKFTVLCRRS